MVDIKKLALLIATSLAELTKKELEALLVELKETHGLEPTQPEIVEVTAEAKTEEKDSFTINLTSMPDQKGAIVRLLKEKLGLSLKESMDLVKEAAKAPTTIKENATKEESSELQEKLIAAGAGVTVS